MGLLAYKMFDPGLKCRGYQFRVGTNTTDHANCRRNGFHCAEDPLDCLSYYPNFDASEMWAVWADGDIDEDGTDTKISCTKITLLTRLNKEEFVRHAVRYAVKHWRRGYNGRICTGYGKANGTGIAIVRGQNPVGEGQEGDVIGLIYTDAAGVPYGFKIHTLQAGEMELRAEWMEAHDEADE